MHHFEGIGIVALVHRCYNMILATFILHFIRGTPSCQLSMQDGLCLNQRFTRFVIFTMCGRFGFLINYKFLPSWLFIRDFPPRPDWLKLVSWMVFVLCVSGLRLTSMSFRTAQLLDQHPGLFQNKLYWKAALFGEGQSLACDLFVSV